MGLVWRGELREAGGGVWSQMGQGLVLERVVPGHEKRGLNEMGLGGRGLAQSPQCRDWVGLGAGNGMTGRH